MRITPAWLETTRHCPDGLAFGLAMLPAAGLELSECWPLIERPDWVVSLAVQAGAVRYADARGAVDLQLRIHAVDMATMTALSLVRYCKPADLVAARAEVAAESYSAVLLGDLPKGHRLNAVALLASADLAHSEGGAGSAVALERLQGAAYCLGCSMGQRKAADALKAALSVVAAPAGA